MIIKFANEKEFEYIDAYTMERDYCPFDGHTRASLQVNMSVHSISYNELEDILNNPLAAQSIMLIGEAEVFEDGTIGEIPWYIHEGFVLESKKITVENGIISFKLYKLSDVEFENELAKQAIDKLLIAMEV